MIKPDQILKQLVNFLRPLEEETRLARHRRPFDHALNLNVCGGNLTG